MELPENWLMIAKRRAWGSNHVTEETTGQVKILTWTSWDKLLNRPILLLKRPSTMNNRKKARIKPVGYGQKMGGAS